MTKVFEKIVLGILVILVFGISSLLIGAQTSDDSAEITSEVASESGKDISPEKAKSVALAAVPGAVTGIEKDIENGVLVYEVEILSNGKETEVLVDLKTGEIIAIEFEEEDEVVTPAEIESIGGLITESKAKQIAVGAVGGSVIGVSREREGGRILYEIELNVDGERAEVEIDAETSEVVEIEWGEDD